MSINKHIIIGNLGQNPEIRTMQSGDKMAIFSVATSERWKDKSTGEQREKTEWHKIVVYNKNIVNVAENYLKKGSKVYIEGQVETRKWQAQDGTDKYTTETVLRPYRSELIMLDSKPQQSHYDGYQSQDMAFDDDIPFSKPFILDA